MKHIVQAVEQEYNIEVIDINHIRTMIGRVYKITTLDCTFLIKWYRPHHCEMALSALQIQRFLSNTVTIVPNVYLALSGEPYILLEDGILVLMEWIEGREVTRQDCHLVLETYQDIHKAMTLYSHPIPKGTSKYYYERYVTLMIDNEFDKKKIMEIACIAEELFERVRSLPHGYCHGDFHTGNMKIRNQQVVVFDFDASHMCSPCIDLVTYLDQTNFNSFRIEDMYGTWQSLKQYLPRDISVENALAFLPIRHMEIIPTIVSAEGEEQVELAFLEEQYNWITSFYRAWKSQIKK